MTNNNQLTIGQLAKLSNNSIATLRHYEKLKLITPNTRSASNYRLYSTDHLITLNFIHNAKSVGLTLKVIKELIDYDSQGKTAADVKSRMQQHLAAIQQKLTELHKIETAVTGLVKQCDGKKTFTDCPIIKELYSNK